MRDNVDLIAGAFCFAIGFVGIGFAFGSRKKLNDICERIDKSIDELSGEVDIDLSETVIKQAVNRAVEAEVGTAVRYATNKAVKSTEKNIQNKVQSAVDMAYSDIRKSVGRELEKQVSDIDIQALKTEVVKKAKADVVDKFNASLDNILEDFNQNLGNVSKIYKSIADTMRFTTGTPASFV